MKLIKTRVSEIESLLKNPSLSTDDRNKLNQELDGILTKYKTFRTNKEIADHSKMITYYDNSLSGDIARLLTSLASVKMTQKRRIVKELESKSLEEFKSYLNKISNAKKNNNSVELATAIKELQVALNKAAETSPELQNVINKLKEYYSAAELLKNINEKSEVYPSAKDHLRYLNSSMDIIKKLLQKNSGEIIFKVPNKNLLQILNTLEDQTKKV